MGLSECSLSKAIVGRLRTGHGTDAKVAEMLASGLFEEKEGLIRVAGTSRILVPADVELREALLHEAHDASGHFGALKTYTELRRSFYWHGMGKDVRKYCSSCDPCQRNKASTVKRQGQHHALPVPPRLFSDVALDFVGPLPKSQGHDMLLTITDRLSGYTRLLPCSSKDGAHEVAGVFFEGWVRLFGQPERIVSDRDKLFTSRFWKAPHKRMGSKLQMSTSFHPETDGRSERTNKTAVQVLRSMVSRRQTDWSHHLASTEYALNKAENVATGKAPFELVLGFVPRISPAPDSASLGVLTVEEVLADREARLMEAQDTLRASKVQQGVQINAKRAGEDVFAVNDLVLISSRDRRRRFKASGDKSLRSAKFFPRYDGPYRVTAAFPSQSLYQLELDPSDNSFNKFHISKLKRYTPNDLNMFPSRHHERPEPVVVGGEEEYEVEEIVDERTCRGKKEYMVKWKGYASEENTWEVRENVEDYDRVG
ncbi:hypothetical protein JCM11641_002320 [Rhodosporidiobolus odoratus]